MRTLNSQYATLALLAGLLFAAMPAANAHDPGYSGQRSHFSGQSYVYLHPASLPRTLRKNRDFMRWYAQNVHRLRYERSWQQAYRRYERGYHSKQYRKLHYKTKRHDPRNRDLKSKRKRRH